MAATARSCAPAKRQAENAIARTEAAIAHLQVQTTQQCRERIAALAFGHLDCLSRRRSEGRQRLDQTCSTRLQILRRPAHVLSLVADKGARAVQAHARDTTHAIEILTRCDQALNFPYNLVLGHGVLPDHGWDKVVKHVVTGLCGVWKATPSVHLIVAIVCGGVAPRRASRTASLFSTRYSGGAAANPKPDRAKLAFRYHCACRLHTGRPEGLDSNTAVG